MISVLDPSMSSMNPDREFSDNSDEHSSRTLRSTSAGVAIRDEPPGPSDEHRFMVTVDRTSGKRLGVAVRQEPSLSAFEILSIDMDEDCAVAQWNDEHPNQKVQKGDFIIGANGKSDDLRAIMKECMRISVLRLQIMRRA
uniref:PDZ domain-containing protein n=1 Tax=Noctiluca scintillans TaxID=2966 RepID=A0A7S1A3Q4_NOCSC|mmetsp:Transcript_30109/g.80364  ORF Transcript_30109/g.80364 Transcript_30109/m.80364 type:complete len:140 (+) Transcript_30109:96-515(+)